MNETALISHSTQATGESEATQTGVGAQLNTSSDLER